MAPSDLESFPQFVLRLSIVGIFTWLSLKWVISALDPTGDQKKSAKKTAEEIMKRLGLKRNIDLDPNELMIAQHLVTPATAGVGWDDIGGYEHIVKELEESVLFPMRLSHTTPLLSPPKGVLLHGPPGCGKTMLAKAIARYAGAHFINLQFSTLTDKWYGESNKLVAAVFSLARKLQPTIIFIDEIDSFLRSRQSFDHEATAMMKAEFLSLWDGFEADPSSQVIILGATNRPKDVDVAIKRRMPLRLYVGMPDEKQRLEILKVILRDEEISTDVNLVEIASRTAKYSGADLKELCRLAAVSRTRHLMVQLRNRTWDGNKMVIPAVDCPVLSREDFRDAMEKFRSSQILDDWSRGNATLQPDDALD